MRRARLEVAEAEMLVVDSSKPEVTYVTFSFADALQAHWLIRNVTSPGSYDTILGGISIHNCFHKSEVSWLFQNLGILSFLRVSKQHLLFLDQRGR